MVISLVGTAALIARRAMNISGAQHENDSALELAARLCGATMPYHETPGIFIWFDSKKLFDEAISQVKSLINADLWHRWYSEGQSLPFDSAIDIAIQALKGEGE